VDGFAAKSKERTMRTKFFILALAITSGLLFAGCPFPVTQTQDTVINVTVIPGVTAPVAGAAPVSSIVETTQYSGTVAWSGNPTIFEAVTVYTATITLTAKAGFTFTGVVANSFTVTGATATNPANSGIVAAVFPATNDGNYTSVNIGTLKYVPAGTFQLDDTAMNTSTVSAFMMSQYEITRAQFLAIMGTDPSNTKYSSGITDPVQKVNWYQAIAFCNKLSLAEGLTPVYSVTVSGSEVNWSTLSFASIPTGISTNSDWDAATVNSAANGYRLPTANEWEWAAMGATSDRTGYAGSGTNTAGYQKAFAGSTGTNAIEDYAVFGYMGTETGRTTTERSNSVGSKLPNELGLYDMSGNVAEWAWDKVDIYRAICGGSWRSYASFCALANSTGYEPNSSSFAIGLRVVRP
jgi:formylglycine-generating enzyme